MPSPILLRTPVPAPSLGAHVHLDPTVHTLTGGRVSNWNPEPASSSADDGVIRLQAPTTAARPAALSGAKPSLRFGTDDSLLDTAIGGSMYNLSGGFSIAFAVRVNDIAQATGMHRPFMKFEQANNASNNYLHFRWDGNNRVNMVYAGAGKPTYALPTYDMPDGAWQVVAYRFFKDAGGSDKLQYWRPTSSSPAGTSGSGNPTNWGASGKRIYIGEMANSNGFPFDLGNVLMWSSDPGEAVVQDAVVQLKEIYY